MNKDCYLTEITIKAGENRRFSTGKSWYSILLIADHDCLSEWDGHVQRCGREDILLMQPGRQLMLQALQRPVQIVYLTLSDQALIRLSDKQTDLLYSMCLVPFGCTAVQAESQVTMLVRNLAHRLRKETQTSEYGNTIMEQSLLCMMLILILRACIAADFHHAKRERPHFMVDDIFVYIREHLAENLSLAQLEKVFFVSHEHIAREFKKQTGQSVHRYILTLRLEQSCLMLQAGQPATRVWQPCGFSSYAYFFQAFRRELGMTPGAYTKAIPNCTSYFEAKRTLSEGGRRGVNLGSGDQGDSRPVQDE